MQKISFKFFLRQSPIWQLTAAAAIFCVGAIVLVATTVQPTDRLLVLHYSIPFGIDLVGKWYVMWVYPGVAAGIFLINLLFGYIAYTRDRVLTVSIFSLTVFCEIIIFVGLFLLFFQNQT